jgi:hypothetical protein
VHDGALGSLPEHGLAALGAKSPALQRGVVPSLGPRSRGLGLHLRTDVTGLLSGVLLAGHAGEQTDGGQAAGARDGGEHGD